jgi:protein-S-isoprenylcysteine O-methyltransferase Ste14
MTDPQVPQRRLLPPHFLLMAILAMVALHLGLPGRILLARPWTFVGLLPFALGGALTVRAARLFDREKTPVRPFERSTRLVLDGPYRFTRNPMYLGMVVGLLGVGVLLGSLTPFVLPILFALFLQARFIVPEEAMLERLFGADYVAFKGRVRRWL